MVEIPGYRILETIGRGGSGIVYRAEQLTLNRVVALKLLTPGLFADEQLRCRFLEEARVLSRLCHPNVIALYAADFAEHQAYVVMEYVDGGSLRSEMMRRGRLPVHRTTSLGAELAKGLHHAHQSGVIHRDVKPENVLLTSEGSAKLGDFGLALSQKRTAGVNTQAGTVLGTPGYVAPELLAGNKATRASDIYAFGVLLHECSAGPTEALARLRKSHTSDRPPPSLPRLSTLVEGIPPDLDALVMDCLQTTPSARPSLVGVVRRLEKLARQAPRLPDPPPPQPEWKTAPLEYGIATDEMPDQHPTEERRQDVGSRKVPFALLLAAALFAAWAGHLRSTDTAPAALFPAVSPSAELCSIHTSCDRARLHLASPAGAGESYDLVDVSTLKTLMKLPAAPGSLSLLASGLRPDQAYMVRPDRRPDLTFPFRTRKESLSAGVCQLLPSSGAEGRSGPGGRGPAPNTFGGALGMVAVAQEGPHVYVVAAFNKTRGGPVQFLESHDGGETWALPVELAAESQNVSEVYAGAVRGTLVAVWHSNAGGQPRLWLSRRSSGRSEWTAPVAGLRCDRPPGVLVAADGVIRAVTADSGTGGQARLRYVECDAATGKELLRAEGPNPGLPGPPILRQRIVEEGSGLFWLARGRTATGDKRGYWSRSTRPELGVWEPVRPLEPASAYSGDFDLHWARGRLVIAHQAPGGLRALVSTGGSDPLRPGTLEPPPGWISSNPVLGHSAKEFLLAYVDTVGSLPGQPGGIRLYGSLDGLRWRPKRIRAGLLAMCRSLGLAATEASACLVAYDEAEGVVSIRLPL